MWLILPIATTPLLPGKVVIPHYGMVHNVSLIAPKRIEPITWDWSHIEDILEENMVSFQNEGKGVPREPQGASKDQKWSKLNKILNFLDFTTIHFTLVKIFRYFYTDLMRNE